MVHQKVAFFEERGADPLVLELHAIDSGESIPSGLAVDFPRYGAVFLDHQLPESLLPQARFGLRVRLQNRGAMTWDPDDRRGRQVSLVVYVDDNYVTSSAMPHPVRPMETVDMHLAIPSPARPGRHMAKLNLVHERAAYFHDHGVRPLCLDIRVQNISPPVAAGLFETALRSNPWFYQPSSGIAFSREEIGFPLFLGRAKGCHVWDTEGRRYIDYTMGWGCALLGHACEPIQQAIRRELESGCVLPLPHPLEMEVTRMLCEDIPCAEAVAFGKNGSDACTLAVRLARLTTRRPIILTCGYHGWQDWFAEAFGFDGTGVPPFPQKLVVRFPFMDLDAFRKLLAAHRDNVAAVILEPSGPAGASSQGTGEDVDPHYLRQLAHDTREAGALLIFDEIMTGFRYRSGSVQKHTGVIPDLACFGKALANGMPLAAVVGSRAIFQAMPRAFYGPTYKGETYSLAAAREALAIYRTEPVSQHIWNFGQRLKDGMNELCRNLDLNARMIGPPFRCSLAFDESDGERLMLLRTLYIQELLKEGLITYNGVMLPSYAHDEQVLRQTLVAAGRALEQVRLSDRDDTLHQDIEIPVGNMSL